MNRIADRLPRLSGVLFSSTESVPAVVLIGLMLLLAVAGGASHPDVSAQAIVRAGSAIALCVLVGFARPHRASRYWAPWLFLGALTALIVVQLIPLPQQVWANLPGHAALAGRLRDFELLRSPRPINLVPDKGLNTLFALIVPAAMLATLSCLNSRAEAMLLPLLILFALGSALASILQGTGAVGQSGLMNGNSASYSGLFANRNHQALLLSIGIATVLFWGQRGGLSRRRPRLWLASFAAILLALSIILTGSRIGIALGFLAIMSGATLGDAGRTRRPRRRYAAVALGLLVGGVSLGLALCWERANALGRFTALSPEDDIRFRSFVPAWELTRTYFPFGSGFGSFDAVFRMIEPLRLLSDRYLNHAHNDFLEFLLEGGAGAACLLILAAAWIVLRSCTAFSYGGRGEARLGVIIFALIALASLFDYPLRTPAMMAVLVIAGSWLARPACAE